MRTVYLIAALLVTLPAFAREEGSTAVPQFDPSSYAGQLFWLVISFALLYVLMAKIALPRTGFVIEQRAQRIAQDLEQARTARDEAEDMQAGYEKGAAFAQASARQTLAEATTAAQNAQNAALAAQNAALVVRVKEAEDKITTAKKQAMTSIEPAAQAIAADVTKKLVGV